MLLAVKSKYSLGLPSQYFSKTRWISSSVTLKTDLIHTTTNVDKVSRLYPKNFYIKNTSFFKVATKSDVMIYD